MLTVRNLEAYYGNIQALKGISFHVLKGEVVCLIGANGAGKTTTLQAISGIISHVDGDILLEEKQINGMSPDKIVARGIVQSPENRLVFAPLSVTDNLRLGAYTRSNNKDILDDIDYVYNLFPRLAERRESYAGNLSGGEQQMLAVGRALMARPRILMLDEPSTGLAPLIIREIFAVISRLKESGSTILLVEQNAHMALKVSDRAYVIETGRIVGEGDADEMMQSQEIQRAYLGSSVDGFLG
jgi:branched-chain amino acid transport system ATP-binding protein